MTETHHAGRARAFSTSGAASASVRPNIESIKKKKKNRKENNNEEPSSMKASSSFSCDSELTPDEKKHGMSFNKRIKRKLESYFQNDHKAIEKSADNSHNNSSSSSLQMLSNDEDASSLHSIHLDRNTNLSYNEGSQEKHVTFMRDNDRPFIPIGEKNRARRTSLPISNIQMFVPNESSIDNTQSINTEYAYYFLDNDINDVFLKHKEELYKIFTANEPDRTDLDQSFYKLLMKNKEIKVCFDNTNEKFNQLNYHLNKFKEGSVNMNDNIFLFDMKIRKRMGLLQADLDEIDLEIKKAECPLLFKPYHFLLYVGCCIFSLLKGLVLNIFGLYKQYH